MDSRAERDWKRYAHNTLYARFGGCKFLTPCVWSGYLILACRTFVSLCVRMDSVENVKQMIAATIKSSEIQINLLNTEKILLELYLFLRRMLEASFVASCLPCYGHVSLPSTNAEKNQPKKALAQFPRFHITKLPLLWMAVFSDLLNDGRTIC